MSHNIPLGDNVLIRARNSRQSKYFNPPKSEFDQTQTVGTIIAVGDTVPENYKKLIGKLVFFPAFQEVRATADPDEPEIFVKYNLIAGYEETND